MISDDKKRVMVTLSADNAKKLNILAKEIGLSKSALITMWINSNAEDSK